jgi:hypothetical protein
MGLIRYSQSAIIVEISDKVFGGTTLKRKVRFDNMVYDQGGMQGGITTIYGNSIPGSVTLNCTVLLFAVGAGGIYGDPLSGQAGFNDYPKVLRADNSTLVYAADDAEKAVVAGQLIGDASLERDPSSFQDGGILDGVDYMYEYEFFRRLAQNVPVVVDELITGTIQNADARGVF